MKRSLILGLIICWASSLKGQTLHIENEAYIGAPAGCTLPCALTADTAPPAIGNEKLILQAGSTFDYALNVTTTGDYALLIRLNGTMVLHFEINGVDVTGPIADVNVLGTFPAHKNIALNPSIKTIRMVVDSVGAGYPSANWFSMSYIAPPGAIHLIATIKWKIGTAVTGGIRINQIENGKPVALGRYLLDDLGNLSGYVSVDVTQPDPVTLQVILEDENGVEIMRNEQTFVKAMFSSVSNIQATLTLEKSTCPVPNSNPPVSNPCVVVAGGGLAAQ